MAEGSTGQPNSLQDSTIFGTMPWIGACPEFSSQVQYAMSAPPPPICKMIEDFFLRTVVELDQEAEGGSVSFCLKRTKRLDECH